jgi:reactive intermediate/imine deaminase
VKEAISTTASPSPIGPYSQGLVTDTLVLVSGQGPLDPATGRVPDGIAAQTHQVLGNIRGILEAGGATMADVIKVTVHLAELADFDAFNGVYREYFPAPYPVRTTVGSQLPGILVEIDAIAQRPARIETA